MNFFINFDFKSIIYALILNFIFDEANLSITIQYEEDIKGKILTYKYLLDY